MRLKFIVAVLLFPAILSCLSVKTKTSIADDYYILGNQYLEMEDYAKAVIYYQKALENNKDLKDVNINLILAYQKSDKYTEAEKIIVAEYKETQNEYNQKLLLLLGNNYFYQNKFDISAKVYGAYFKSYPSDINGVFNLALSYYKLGDEKNFLFYLNEGYKINKTYIPILFNLGDYYYNKKDYKSCLIYYKELIDLDKTNPDVFAKLGEILYLTEEYELAKEQYIKSIELNDANSAYYLALAKVYAKGYNDKKMTFENIEKALINGFTDLSYLQAQKEFDILEEFPDYKDLLKKYKLIK